MEVQLISLYLHPKTNNMQNNKTRPLHVIASEIRKDWKKVYFGAEPYLDAMSNLDFGSPLRAPNAEPLITGMLAPSNL